MMEQYDLKIVSNFSNSYSRNNLIERLTRLFYKTFADPNKLWKLNNIVECIDYTEVVKRVCGTFDRKILWLLMLGYSQQDVATSLCCAQSTISRRYKQTLKRIYDELR